MPDHKEKRFLPFAPVAMFELVADVEKYPEFLPWCSAARVEAKQRDEKGREFFDAELCVSYKQLNERFLSRVFLDRANMQIEICYLEGPFRHLNNRWVFTAKEQDGIDGVEVDFSVSFAFRSKLLGYFATPIFSEVVRRITTAFAKRAEALYGSRS